MSTESNNFAAKVAEDKAQKYDQVTPIIREVNGSVCPNKLLLIQQ